MLERKRTDINETITIEELFEILRRLTLGEMKSTTVMEFIGSLIEAGFKGEDNIKEIIEDIREHQDEEA